MKIILKSIEITNFKGIEHLKLNFNDSYNVIYGDNETGKSSIYDAFCYCLTGKNSAGETNFSIVPKWLEIKPGIISPSVKIELQIDEKSTELERIYKAEFNKIREFKGFATKCFVDSVPKGVNEFSAFIKDIFGELDFRLVTNIKYFSELITASNGLTSAQKQLNILLEMVKEKSELEFAKENEKYFKIIPLLEKFDSAQAIVAYSKKQISDFKKAVNDIPIKIEQQSLNFVQIDCKENRKELLQQISDLQAEIKDLHSKLSNTAYSNLAQEKLKLENSILQLNSEIQFNKENQTGIMRKVDELTESSKNIGVCQYCGNNISSDKQNEMLSKINNELAIAIDAYNSFQERILNLTIQSKSKKEELELLKEKSTAAETSFNQDREVALNQLEEKQKQLKSKEEIVQILAQNEKCQKVISGLEDELSAAYSKLDEAQQTMTLLLDLIQFISNSTQNKVNDLFNQVIVKLYDYTNNGEVTPTCVILYNGIEYKNLSASTKTICNLDIVNGFQKFYNVKFPMFIDNAEGITSDFNFDGQIITLVVKQAFCPTCGGVTGRKQENNLWKCTVCGKQFKKEVSVESMDWLGN